MITRLQLERSLSMCSDSRGLTWTPVLLLLSGVLCKETGVYYQEKTICAVKGSSVVIPCLFNYPDNKKVQRVMWGHGRNHARKQFFDGPFIFNSDSVDNSTKFQYIGNKFHSCSFKINQVEHADSGEYAFRFETDSSVHKFTGYPGSTLKTGDLKAVVTKPNGDGTVIESDCVNLTCVNDCDGGSPSSAFTWFKNGEPINEGPALYFSNISPQNSGYYSCSLTAHNGTTSEVININVEYGPKNTSLSALPSTEFAAGSNITLACSSYANPQVDNYTWFKIGDGHTTIVSYGFKLELHFWDVSLSGDLQYFCSATNKHGSQNSPTVTLRMDIVLPAHPHSTYTRDLIVAAATVAALLILMTIVIVVRRLNKKRMRAPDTASEEDDQNAIYLNWPRVGNQCEETTTDSALLYVTVDFNTKRKSNMQQHMDSHKGDDDDDEGVLYTSVCRDQNLNL